MRPCPQGFVKHILGITEQTDLSSQLFRVLQLQQGRKQITTYFWLTKVCNLKSHQPSGYLAGFVKTTVRGYPRWANFGASTILLLAFSRTPAMANPGGGLDFP